MSFLELRNVSKAYGTGPAEVQALENIDVSVDRGALVAVMGPSGSGKSTLLTIAGSLEEPTSGEVMIGGAALTKMSRNDKALLRRRTIGYVFQDFNLLPGLTAAENVCLPLELDGMRAKKAYAAGMAALEKLGLADRATHYPDELSGGERQRVSIARAIVGERHLLLADDHEGQRRGSYAGGSSGDGSSARVTGLPSGSATAATRSPQGMSAGSRRTVTPSARSSANRRSTSSV